MKIRNIRLMPMGRFYFDSSSEYSDAVYDAYENFNYIDKEFPRVGIIIRYGDVNTGCNLIFRNYFEYSGVMHYYERYINLPITKYEIKKYDFYKELSYYNRSRFYLNEIVYIGYIYNFVNLCKTNKFKVGHFKL